MTAWSTEQSTLDGKSYIRVEDRASLSGNEEALYLTGRQLQGLQRFNRFVILVYIQSWYSCRLAVDAPFNDIALIHRLQKYDDVELSRVGLLMMVRHSWYLSPELASLALFSNHVDNEVKVQLVAGMQQD